jgi:isopentenyl-diphosphate delta-isomerase
LRAHGQQVSGWAVAAAAGKLLIESLDDLPFVTADVASLKIETCDADFATRVRPGQRHGQLDVELTDPTQRQTFDALLASQRKIHHIEICQTRDVESSDRDNGLSDVAFMPRALPGLDWDEIDCSASFLGRTFRAPILITGMTGGVNEGRRINHILARAAAEAGIPMGVGSQRLALEDTRYAPIFDVKKEVPGVFLIANIGAAQLASASSPEAARTLCRAAVDMIQADALAIHINVLQELIQIEGDRNFRGVAETIRVIAADFPVPVMVKEVGAGMDPQTALELTQAGVDAIDVGGRGGTSWGWIEGLRAKDPDVLEIATTFRDWGLTTGKALRLARAALQDNQLKTGGTPSPALVATGGIRTGLDVAKAVALGASMTGIGLPLFRAALQAGSEGGQLAVGKKLSQLVRGLKTAMMCTGSRDLSGLRGALIDHSRNMTGVTHPVTTGGEMT